MSNNTSTNTHGRHGGRFKCGLRPSATTPDCSELFHYSLNVSHAGLSESAGFNAFASTWLQPVFLRPDPMASQVFSQWTASLQTKRLLSHTPRFARSLRLRDKG